MKILFVNLSALRFTAATPDGAPLGGSESSLCYLARALLRRGHDLSLMVNLPDGEHGIIEGIRHFPSATIKNIDFFATEKFNVIILCNAPAAAAPLRLLSPWSRLVLWAHVLPDQASMQILVDDHVKKSLDMTVFVSRWQKNQIEHAFGPFRNTQIIGNGIAPVFENMFSSPSELLAAKQNRAAFASTPYRGLSVLVRAMENFKHETKLDVYSSMRVYQADDTDYAPLFQRAERNPATTCHGSVTQRVLADQLRVCAFLFYPCIYPETFCIVVAEAMAAGLEIVTTRLGALEETTMGFSNLVRIDSSEGTVLVHDFCAAMEYSVDFFIANPGQWAQKMFDQTVRANASFSWAARAMDWEKAITAVEL